MATAAETDMDTVSDSECSVCHESFRQPKVLECGHELCAPCLESLLTSQKTAPCPLCRHPIMPRDWAHSVEHFVQELPTDVAMSLRVESQHLLDQDHACQSCQAQAASSLCLHCRDFLCSPCTAQHARLSATRHHQVEPLASLTPQQLAAGSFPACQAHPSELCRLYCTSHQVPICLLCASSKHRTCGQLKDAEERTAESQALLTEVVSVLTQEERQLNQRLQTLDDLELDADKAAIQADTDIDAAFDRLDALLKKSRLAAKEKAQSTFSQRKAAVQQCRQPLLQRKSIVTKHKAIAEQGKSMASGDMGDMAAALKKRAVDIQKSSGMQDVVIPMVPVVISSRAMAAVEEALTQITQGASFCFHGNCGENIVLSNGQQTAERKGSINDGGIVVGKQPMMPGLLYEVALDTRDRGGGSGWQLLTGVATSDPGGIALPSSLHSKWKDGVFFGSDTFYGHTTTTASAVGKKLNNLPEGSRVGVLLDDQHRVHLYVDGQDQGHTDTRVTQPCFPLFQIVYSYRKITTLPVRTMP